MPKQIIDNREHGPLYPTTVVQRAAVLRAAGHNIVRFSRDQRGRLVFSFPKTSPEGVTVHDTLRKYINNDLPVDAKTLIDCWMELRDLTRNKEFASETIDVTT